MNYVQARQAVKDGKQGRRASWTDGQIIRLAEEKDKDPLNYDNIDGLVVSECQNRKCDCIVCLYVPTNEDQAADDWEITG